MFSVQGLLLGLLGYLIQFAPLAFIPHCQIRSRKTPSRLLVHMGSTHFAATPYVLLTPPGLKALQYLMQAGTLRVPISQKT
jgi:hypothetical protein